MSLVSKSKSINFIGKVFKNTIQSLYEDLNEIEEISLILQVIQYVDYLDIVFDFNQYSTHFMDHNDKTDTKGKYEPVNGRVYIGAKVDESEDPRERGPEERLGTVAHEHM
jgi:hypothetical protein